MQETVVENPYGLGALIANGNIVSRSILAVLLIMSLMTWFIMITKFFDQRRLRLQAIEAEKEFWSSSSLTDAIGTSEWITESLQRTADAIISRMQTGLPVLASVGATAPFVGLLGTVIGIYNALIAIGVAGQASIDKVAGPVGEALIMTAIGLAVAVPAVLGYNILLRRNKGVQEMVSHFTHELHAYLISGAKMGLGMDKGQAPPTLAKSAPAAAR